MVLWAIAGILAGCLARFVVPDGGATGLAGDTLIGLLGGLAGGFTYHLFGHKPAIYGYDAMSILCAAVGACVLLLVVRAGSGRRTVS
ncbi:MAG: GlsB/YeaQ/YmgE family stress response membrane protein [Candidatus Eremiobacteraeota bacterium]|nr:GlsB/YeaQ/YmgE family stress response membrane protein [Candidatus Eremiobacteraeota bacterium]